MTTSALFSDNAIATCAADLVSCGSIEMSAHRVADARALAELLPSGTKVYVNHLPRNTLVQTLESLRALREAGLEPVPHIAARRVASKSELEEFIGRATGEAGVQKALVIGGDDPEPAGPYADSVTLIEDGILARCGLREVGISGYPEGHATIPRASLERALRAKLAAAAAQGLGVYVVTQFSFAPGRIVEFCSELARAAPKVPVFVGLAGPADIATLFRFAQRCGVSASLRGLRAQGFGVVKLVTHTDPGEQLAAIARYCLGQTSCNVVGAHFYSFGGAAKTAGWMNRILVPQPA